MEGLNNKDVAALLSDLTPDRIRGLLVSRQSEKNSRLLPSDKEQVLGTAAYLIVGFALSGLSIWAISFLYPYLILTFALVVILLTIAFSAPYVAFRLSVPLYKRNPGWFETKCPHCYETQTTSNVMVYWKCRQCDSEIVRYRRENWLFRDIIFEESFLVDCLDYEQTGGGAL
jgi:hypothetical protein